MKTLVKCNESGERNEMNFNKRNENVKEKNRLTEGV